MHITSTRQNIGRPVNTVYSFIRDFRNFEHLMPAQVQNYLADYDQCSFEISSMGQITLEMVERIDDSSVKAASSGNTAIKFELSVGLFPESAGTCAAVVELNAELSPMLAMIAKNPLNNFINMLVDKLKQVMEAS